MPTYQLIISGRVQGVGYRAWTVATAHRLKLNGWVRNRKDGTVEALVSGEEDTIHELIEVCKDGPLAARVTDIQSRPSDEKVNPGFISKPTV